jgi:Xaa-Pro dipeptidase
MKGWIATVGMLGIAMAVSPCMARQAASTSEQMPKLLPWSKQIAVREQWLVKRHAMLLDMMRRNHVEMWIVVNEEFHDDPLTEFVAPPRPYAGGRDIFVFIDAGDKGLRKIALTGYSEESIQRFFESASDPKPAAEQLRGLWDTYHPQHIALGIDGRRGVTRSLTKSTYEFLAQAMGAEATAHFVAAQDLIDEYLDTRIPEEFDTYTQMVALTEDLTHRALSNEVITPGKTTVGDIRRWLYDQMWENRVGTWFQPDVRVQRKEAVNEKSRGFLAVAKEDVVVEPGDVLHIDFGITYMGLNTDWQKMAYVLLPGEKDAPEGLKQALRNTNELQDALTLRAARPGRTGGEVYNLSIGEMKQKGIKAMIYSHPIGNQGHGLGASIDFRAASADSRLAASASEKLRKGSYLSVELNTCTDIPEWGNQSVCMMEEDDAYLTDDGYKFFRPRQTELYLVQSH